MRNQIKNTIKVEIREGKEGYQFEYHFSGKHGERIEVLPYRYMRILAKI